MIVLLGATGYIGQAFALELQRRGLAFAALSRKEIDYTRFEVVLEYLRRTEPKLVINAAGYTGKPNVDACETARADTLQGNTMFPAMLAHACAVTKTPWGHVSSGCIYSGGKVVAGGAERVERDLARPELRSLFERQPESFRGFAETDSPNFSFRAPPCSFYSGSKALGEEAILECGLRTADCGMDNGTPHSALRTPQCYVWRLRIPFDEIDGPRNYLSKVQRYPKVYDNINSISHRGDFVRACLDLWERRAPFGIYNVTNPGAVSTRQVVQTIQRVLKPTRRFEFWESDEEFYRVAAKTPRSNCILDVSKLLATGVTIRPVEEALEHAIHNWRRDESLNR